MAGTAIFGLSGGMFAVSMTGALLVAPNAAYAGCSSGYSEVYCSTWLNDSNDPYRHISRTSIPGGVNSVNLTLFGSQVRARGAYGVNIRKNGYANVTVTTEVSEVSGLAPEVRDVYGGGAGLDVDVRYGNITVNHNAGAYRGFSGYGMNLRTRDGHIVVNTLSDTYTAGGRTGILLRAGNSNENERGGNITVFNEGTVRGYNGHGLDASAWGHVNVTNSSFNSMVGYENGARLHDSNQVTHNNNGGLTAGLTQGGLVVFNIEGYGLHGGAEYDEYSSVEISNREGGSITGGYSGIYLAGISRERPFEKDDDESPFNGNAVVIDNSGSGEEGDMGGLIFGAGSNGIHGNYIGGNVVIMNQNTLQSTLDTLADEERDDLFDGDRPEDSDNTVQDIVDLGDWSRAQAGITGIFGVNDGISLYGVGQMDGGTDFDSVDRDDDFYRFASGGVDIANDGGLIIGSRGNGINLQNIGPGYDAAMPGYSVDISNAGGYIIAAGEDEDDDDDDDNVASINGGEGHKNSRHGINIEDAEGHIYINNGATSEEGDGGLIAALERDWDGDSPHKGGGRNQGDGVHIDNTYGNVFINNYRGLIYSGDDDAVSINGAAMSYHYGDQQTVLMDDDYDYNAVYIGYHNIIPQDKEPSVSDVESDEVMGQEMPDSAVGYDYYIAENGSAIQVKNTDNVYVNTGGLGIGSGQMKERRKPRKKGRHGGRPAWDAVTKFENFDYVSHQNSGILGSYNLPGFYSDSEVEDEEDTDSNEFDDLQAARGRLDQIVADIKYQADSIQFFVFNMDDGGVEFLYGYGDAADDMLVYTSNRGRGPGMQQSQQVTNVGSDEQQPHHYYGSTYMMNNTGLMVGRVALDRDDENTIYNSGKWFTRGKNELGRMGFIHNEQGGLIQTAFTHDGIPMKKPIEQEEEQEDDQQTIALDIEPMEYFTRTRTRFNVWGFQNDGVLSMMDGEANDRVGIRFYSDRWEEPGLVDVSSVGPDVPSMEYDYASGWSGNGYLAVDVDFYEGQSDVLKLGIKRRRRGKEQQQDIITDNEGSDEEYVPFYIAGSTGIISNTVNTMPGNFDGEITVVKYGKGGMIENGCSGNCKAGDAFYISEYSEGYAEVDGIGFVTGEDSNWLSWYLVHDEEDRRFEYQAGASPGGAQLPGLQTQMQNVWYETQGVVSDHIRADRFGGSGLSSTSNADLVDIIPEAPQADAERYNSKGIWAKIQGSWTNRDTAVNTVIGGGAASFDTSYDQDIFSILGGFDMLLGQDSPVRVGVFGGYINSSADFNSWATSSDADGGTVGAYVDYTKDNFYVDATFKADFLNIDYSTNITGVNAQTGSADVTNYGVEANAGYRFNATHGFIEPIISATYVHTQIDNFALGGVSAGFSNAESIRGGVGARVGTNKRFANGMQGEFTLLGKVWNEFENANQVTLVDTLGNTASFTDGINGVFGEVEGGINIFNAAKNASAFVSGGAEFNSDFTTYNAKAGFRWTW